tara:strand:- start:38 stop:433 length:396 start_codon:yes stop_codon:yes gene_type:complete
MAHFARVADGIVKDVIVAEQDFIDSYDCGEPGTWIQTSYNTHGGVHYTRDETGEWLDKPSSDQKKALRKNFAGIGFTYDSVRDAFIPPQDFPSWTLNETTCLWEAPVAYPDDGKLYQWDESNKRWIVETTE